MSDELEETANEVKNRVFRSRFFGSFVIAFAAINWRAIYVLLFPSSDLGFLDRMEWMDSNLYSAKWVNAIKLILGPIAYACFNVAVLPRFINWLEEYRYRASVDHKNARERIDERLRHKQLEIASVKGMLSNEKEQSNKLQGRVNELEKVLEETTKQTSEARATVREFIRVDRVLRLVLEDIARDPHISADPIDLSLLAAAGLVAARDPFSSISGIHLTDEGTKMLLATPMPEKQ